MQEASGGGDRPNRATIDLPLDARSARRARQMAADVLAGWGVEDPEIVHDARVALSELVTTVETTATGGKRVWARLRLRRE